MKARLIDTGGKDTIIGPKNGKDFTLPELYELLDTDLVEVVVLPNSGKLMIMDEEGKLKGKLVNGLASAIYNKSSDFIVGKVIICERSMFR